MAIDGRVLAAAGINVGQQIGKATEQFGQNVGGMLTDVGEGFSERRSAREAQELLQQYANDPAQLNALGQKYATEGSDALSKVFFRAADASVAKQNEKTKATGSRGKGELMALANNPKFDINNQKMQSGYFGMADAYGVTREEAMKIATDAKKGRDGTGKVTSSRSGGQYRDKDNNIYELSIQRTPEGEGQAWLPITKGAPSEPVGKVTPIGGAYSETAKGKMERDIDTAGGTTEAEQYAKLRIEAIDSLPAIERTISSTESSLEVLETIKSTGGWSGAAVRAAQRFLGEEPANEADFNLKAGQQILDGLSAFTGAISEGERNYLESLYQSLARSKGANRAILEEMLDVAQRNLRDAQTRANSGTFGEYMTNRQSFDAPLTPPNNRVNFNDLKRGS